MKEMMNLTPNESLESRIQEEQYVFPYHYLSLYDIFYRLFAHRHYISLLEKIREIIPITSSDRILDAGCGDGRFSHMIKDVGAQIVGVDYSERAITFAKAFSPTVSFRCADLSSFQNEPFDKVYCIEVIEHLPPQHLQTFVKALTACLKPDGYLVISVPSKAIPVSKKHFQHFSVNDIRTLFVSEKLDITKIEGHIRASDWCKWMKMVDLAKWLYAFPVLNRLTRKSASVLEKYFIHIRNAPIENCVNLIVVMQKKA